MTPLFFGEFPEFLGRILAKRGIEYWTLRTLPSRAMNATREKEIFLAGIAIESVSEREAYLDRTCAGDPELRHRVAALFEAQCRNAEFLEQPIAKVELPSGSEQPGTQIGPYKLLQQIGEGGFGDVYMAEQLEPVRRKVALKIIKAGMDTKEVIARFEAERQALALMDHNNVAKVLDAGTTDSGRPYFAMELVHGVPITEFCGEQRLSIRERLALFVQVCRAVQHAHLKGIIHRDLKPTNILVTMDDDHPVPKVIDFGIAKALNQTLTDKTIFTSYGQMMGTPLYMSPEQSQFSARDVDTRSDVYSLGVLLYELLTGTTPFEKETLRESGYEAYCQMVREVYPPLPSMRVNTLGQHQLSTSSQKRKVDPRRFSKSLQGELDWIVMRALEKDRSRRYESASAFAADVERYLKDEPVQACPPSFLYTFSKFARRRKVVLTTTFLVTLSLIVGIGVAVWQANEANKARETAEENLKDAETARIEAKSQANLAQLRRQEALHYALTLAADRGMALCEQREIAQGLLWFSRALELAPEEDVDFARTIRANISSWSRELAPLRHLCRLSDGTGIRAMAIDPENGLCVTVRRDSVQCWNTSTGELATELPVSRHVFVAAAIIDSGRRVFFADSEGNVFQWRVREERLEPTPVHSTQAIDRLEVSPDGRMLLVGNLKNRRAELWDLASADTQGHSLPTRFEGGRFSRNGKHLAIWALGRLELWDPQERKRTQIINDDGHLVRTAVFSADEQFLAYSRANSATFYDLTNRRLVRGTFGHRAHVSALAVDRSAKRLLSGSFDRTAQLWDLPSGQPLGQPLRHEGKLVAVGFHRNANRFATLCDGREARVWESPAGRNVFRDFPHSAPSYAVQFSRDERLVASISGDPFAGKLNVWDLATGELRHSAIRPHITRFAFHPNGEEFATIEEHAVCLWKLGDTTRRAQIVLPAPSRAYSLAYTADGTRLFIGSSGKVHSYELGSLPPVGAIFENSGINNNLVLNPNDRTVLAASNLGSIKVWDTESGKVLSEFSAGCAPVTAIAFRGADELVAVAGAERRVLVFSQEGRLLAEPLRAERDAREVSLHPTGNQLISVGGDGTARVFDISTGRAIGPLMEHYAPISSAVFAQQGRFIATVAPDSGLVIAENPIPVRGTVEEVRLWIETITGMRLDQDQIPVLLAPDEWHQRRQRLTVLGDLSSDSRRDRSVTKESAEVIEESIHP